MNYQIKCKDCKRFLGNTNKSTEVELKCSNSKCKALHNYKVVFISDYLKGHSGFDKIDSRETK